MQMLSECVLLGTEKKKGVKDPTKTYCMALFGQGTDTLNCICNDDAFDLLTKCKLYAPVNCIFDFNNQFKNIRLTGIDNFVPAKN